MKLKVSDLYGLDESLTDLSNKEIPITTGLIVKRNLTKVADELRPVNDMRTDLINDHKSKIVGDMAEIDKDKKKDFYKKYNELMNQEVDVKLDKIKLSDLTSVDGLKIKPATLTMLDPILIEDDEDE